VRRAIAYVALEAHLYAEVLRRDSRREDEAVALLKKILEAAQDVLEHDDVRLMQVHRSLAEALLDRGDRAAAAKEYAALVDRSTRALGREDFSTMVFTYDYGRILIMDKQLRRGIKVLTPFVASARRILGPDHGLTERAAYLIKRANQELTTGNTMLG